MRQEDKNYFHLAGKESQREICMALAVRIEEAGAKQLSMVVSKKQRRWLLHFIVEAREIG